MAFFPQTTWPHAIPTFEDHATSITLVESFSTLPREVNFADAASLPIANVVRVADCDLAACRLVYWFAKRTFLYGKLRNAADLH